METPSRHPETGPASGEAQPRTEDCTTLSPMKSPYRSRVVQVPGWRLPTDRPRVLVAQISLDFATPVDDDGRIRSAPSSDRDALLLELIQSLGPRDAQFLVLPEYACPLALLPRLLDTAQTSIPEGAVCLLPFEHLSVEEYHHLLAQVPLVGSIANLPQEYLLGDIQEADRARGIVNVCLILGRAAGRLWAIPQLKLQPAGLEEPAALGRWRFCKNGTLWTVSGKNCRFGVMVCFDFIARDDSRDRRPREQVAHCNLDLLFVPECNPSPLHGAYAIGAVDLYERSVGRPLQTLMVFANVGMGTHLPGLAEPTNFGFSSVLGNLGSVSRSVRNVFFVRHGVVAIDNARTLAEVEKASGGFIHPVIQSLLVRPQESLLNVLLPTLHRPPSRNPEVGRTNTEAEVLRRVRASGQTWQPIRSARHQAEAVESITIPRDHIVEAGLVGFEDFEREFLDALAQWSTPVWVTGPGGGGKTALVATVLDRQYPVGGPVRVIWLDMARVASSDDSLREAILLHLGRARALEEPPAQQWDALADWLKVKPTVIVLDSFERSGLKRIPGELVNLHAWPSRVVVTSRMAEERSKRTPIELDGFGEESAREIMRRTSGHEISAEFTRLVFACIGGLPLGCIWIGGLIARESARDELEQRLRTGIVQNLQTVYEWSVDGLMPAERKILALLCDVTDPLVSDDISRILEIPGSAVDLALDTLRSRNLSMRMSEEGGAPAVHTRHPFVRQFAESVLVSEMQEVRSRVASWVERELMEYGGDWNWEGFERLQRLWPNLRPTIERLHGPDATNDEGRQFLNLWRRADYFLWSKGRWRERKELADVAAGVAGNLKYTEHEAFALCASAEIEWYISKNPKPVEEKLGRALQLYEKPFNAEGCAHALYYRARLLRTLGTVEEAREAAAAAITAAERTENQYTLGLAYNNQGNLLMRRVGDRDAAACAYCRARECFDHCNDHRGTPEMKAVIERNLGRLALDAEQYGDALVALEEAMSKFRLLHHNVEDAEAGAAHAEALAGLGEFDEALEEIDAVQKTLERLGSVTRAEEIREARRRIEVLVQRKRPDKGRG
jgi:tetratricopeptide (TPR) repeat protein